MTQTNRPKSDRDPADEAQRLAQPMKSPFIPLMWILIPLFLIVAYGLATR